MAKKLISLKEAIIVLNDAHDINPENAGRDAYSTRSIYNAIHKKRIKRYGPRHFVQVDKEELLRLFGPKKAS